MTDPEDVTELRPSDLEETEVDEADDSTRPEPLEADPADVVEQRQEVPADDDEEQDVES